MAPSGSKRQNAMLERSYKKATGVRDERKGAYVNPTRVIEAAFLFFALKAARILRVDAATEEEGMDVSKHGGLAYVSETPKAAA